MSHLVRPGSIILALFLSLLAPAFVMGADEPTTAPARPQPLLPPDPVAVVRFRFPRTLKQAALYFARRAGRAKSAPAIADPFGSALEALKVKEGVGAFSDIWLIHVDVATVEQGRTEPRGVLLVPVSDYDAFLGNYQIRAGPDDAGIAEIGFDGGGSAFAAHRDNYAVLATHRALLDGTGDWRRLEVGGALGEAWDRHDVGCYVDFKAALKKGGVPWEGAGVLWPLSEDGRIVGDLLKSTLGTSPFPAVQRAVQDANGLVAGMSVDDDGIHATLAADFRPGTDIARRLERVKNTEGSLTAPLPDTTYWVAGGWSLPPGEAWAVVELLSQWAASALDTGGAKPKWAALIDRGLDPVKPLFAAADGSIGVLPGNLRQGLVRGFSRLGGPGGDSQATLAACRAAVERLGAKTVYAPGVREMDGVSLGRFSYDLRGGENDSRQLEADGFFDSLYGRSRESNLGALDSRTVLAALNLVDAETRGAIAAARSSRDPIAHRPGVPAVNARLPRARAAVCYVFLDRMFRSAVTIAREYGLDLAPYRLPPDLPPMGITLCVDGRAARIDAYLPADLLRALERACRQAMRIDEEAP